MDLKKSGESYMGEFGGRKEKGKKAVIILHPQSKNK